jgi:hypothetical protein
MRASLIVVAGIILSTAPVFAEDPAFDLSAEVAVTSDYMDTGVTKSDHKPALSFELAPSYGIFYAGISGGTIDYDAAEPKFELSFEAGATPEFGDLSVDFNLTRNMKIDDPSSDEWVPYVTATYAFSETFSASLGGGYYLEDDDDVADFGELYLGSTVTFPGDATFETEFYWEPDSDGANNTYYELVGTLTVPFHEKFEFAGKLGYEGYEDASLASYAWWETRLTYNVNDHIALSAAYHGNDLSGSECPSQAYTDCDHSFFATLTLKGAASDLK